jgi:hypothetical protein
MRSRFSGAPGARRIDARVFSSVLSVGVAVVCLAASTAAISAGSLAPSAAQPQQDTSFTVRPIKSRLGLISATDPGLLGRS